MDCGSSDVAKNGCSLVENSMSKGMKYFIQEYFIVSQDYFKQAHRIYYLQDYLVQDPIQSCMNNPV